MTAILMTSLLGSDAELRWMNWLGLLQILQSLIRDRSPKSHEIYTGPFFGPFDIDYQPRFRVCLERGSISSLVCYTYTQKVRIN